MALSLDMSFTSTASAPINRTYNKRHRTSSTASSNVATLYLNFSLSLNKPTNGQLHALFNNNPTPLKYQNHHPQKYFSTYLITHKTHPDAQSNTSRTTPSQTPPPTPVLRYKNLQGFTPNITHLTIAYSHPPKVGNQLSVCTIHDRGMPVSSYITDK